MGILKHMTNILEQSPRPGNSNWWTSLARVQVKAQNEYITEEDTDTIAERPQPQAVRGCMPDYGCASGRFVLNRNIILDLLSTYWNIPGTLVNDFTAFVVL